VAVFQRVHKELKEEEIPEKNSEPISPKKEDGENNIDNNINTNNTVKSEKKSFLNFLDVSTLKKEELGDLKFNPELVKDITEVFKQQIQTVGT